MARIGLLGLWTTERGAGIVNLNLYRALTELGHEVFVFARMGSVYGKPLQQSTGVCEVPYLQCFPDYQVPPTVLKSWATYHQLSAMVFSEEYDFSLPMALQKGGMKTVGYIDFLARQQRPMLRAFDQFWTATHRTEGILQEWGKGEQTQFIGWGVPADGFGELENGRDMFRYDYMHNAGWLGIHCRKGTDSLLAAMGRLDDDVDTLIHCQLPEEAAKQVIGWTDGLPPHIVWEDRTIPPPGLYHLGRVVVQPSKLEGLGLTLVEAMAAGRPVITVDAPPMHEFVTPETGWLVPVDRYVDRGDGICFPEAHITPDALAKAMQESLAATDTHLERKADATLVRAKTLFDWERFKGRLAQGLQRIGMEGD